MKNLAYLISAMFLVLLASCQQKPLNIENISIDQLEAQFSNGEGVLLDVRTPQEVAQGCIPNATVINYYDSDFAQKVSMIQKNQPVYVYCRSGGRSKSAARVLSKQGQAKVYNLSGGFSTWKKAGKPIELPKNQKQKKKAGLSLADFNNLVNDLPIVLIDFHAEWCVPCQKMAPIIDRLKEQFPEQKIIKIDVDASAELAQHYKVKSVPTFVLFERGEEKWRKMGVQTEESLTQSLQGYAQ